MTRRERVIDWLRALSAALSTRQLYRADHPRVRDAIAAIVAASDRLSGDAASTSLLMIEGRLMCDDEPIAGAGPTAAKVFDALAACGYDRLTIARGVTPQEIDGLISALAGAGGDAARDESARLTSTAHLTFSVLDMAPAPPPAGASSSAAGDRVRITDVWQGIDGRRAVDADALDHVLTPLVDAARGGTTSLPLATIEHHDDYTATHITNVAVLTMALAESMGVPATAIRQIGVAALLHDVGKMKVPASILNASGPLTGDDLQVMRRHPEIGAQMLMTTPGLPPLPAIVAFEHHLQADGGGYPDVPPGWQINPASAMTHVADVYDALRTHRPYRAALDHEKIVDLMMRDRGTVFAADILDVFFERVVPRAMRRGT
jgi:putative nucleotidyltransferase with HDIG domain